jgi:hypothetical protein
MRGVWSDEDINHVLGDYGTFVVTRSGTDIEAALENLQKWKTNIYVSTIRNQTAELRSTQNITR